MNFLQSFKGNKFDNTSRIARIAYRFNLYSRIIIAARGRVPPTQLLRTQFPYLLPDAKAPPALSVELTNYCNLACPYCTSPLKRRPQGMMSDETFTKLIHHIKDSKILKVGLVGNGEPTLHTKFTEYLPQLREVVGFLTLTSNMQRVNSEILTSVLNNINVVNISVDGGNKQDYEKMRIRGNFERLLDNFVLLNQLKKELNSSCIINIRLMLRPSQRENETELLSFWRDYGDAVSKQYIIDYLENFDDAYTASYQPKARCTLPAKILDVHWNGNVPLCSYSEIQTGNPEGLIIGNINENSLKEIWRSSLISQYRLGHRNQNNELTPICEGCTGRT